MRISRAWVWSIFLWPVFGFGRELAVVAEWRHEGILHQSAVVFLDSGRRGLRRSTNSNFIQTQENPWRLGLDEKKGVNAQWKTFLEDWEAVAADQKNKIDLLRRWFSFSFVNESAGQIRVWVGEHEIQDAESKQVVIDGLRVILNDQSPEWQRVDGIDVRMDGGVLAWNEKGVARRLSVSKNCRTLGSQRALCDVGSYGALFISPDFTQSR